jgi:hypothetical protein
MRAFMENPRGLKPFKGSWSFRVQTADCDFVSRRNALYSRRLESIRAHSDLRSDRFPVWTVRRMFRYLSALFSFHLSWVQRKSPLINNIVQNMDSQSNQTPSNWKQMPFEILCIWPVFNVLQSFLGWFWCLFVAFAGLCVFKNSLKKMLTLVPSFEKFGLHTVKK